MEAKDKNNLEQNELRSDEIQDVLSEPPNSLLTWANLAVAVILLSVVLFSWFVEYPSTINGKAVISSANPPIEVYNTNAGVLERVWVANGSVVSQGQVVLSIKGPVAGSDLIRLRTFLTATESFLDSATQSTFPYVPSDLRLKEIQGLFNDLASKLNQYQALIKAKYTGADEKVLKAKINEYEQMMEISNLQAGLLKQEFEASRKQFEMQRKEYDMGYITQADFLKADMARLQAEIRSTTNKKSLIQDKIALDDLKQELNLLVVSRDKTEKSLRQSIGFNIADIESQLVRWEALYTLKAPINGVVAFPVDYATGQFLAASQTSFTVVPDYENLEVKAKVAASGIGNIKLGHKARLQFDIYPANNYGYVEGRVKSIALLPEDETYSISIELPNGLKSNLGNELEYRPQMRAQLEILTDEIKLFDRIFGSLFSVVK